MRIRGFDTNEQVLVVAEIGNNHEGNLDVARELVQRAADCGVDAVKFQTFRTDQFVRPADAARYQRMRRFELSPTQFGELQQLAHSRGLLFSSTPLDLTSAQFLTGLVDCFKVASGDINFYPLLECLSQTGKPIIISSGASDLDQVRASKQFVEQQWQRQGIGGSLAVLHCVSNYPVPPQHANLSAIRLLADELGCEVGYSDHTIGLDACVLSVALGARIIEKHFTLDKHFSDFRDHQLSADPAEMKELVERVRRATLLLGNSVKAISDSERDMVPLIRRSIVSARALPCGHRLRPDDLTWLRPADGLAPGQEHQLVGRPLNRSVSIGDTIRLADVA